MVFLVEILSTALQLYSFVLLARVLMSWIPIDTSNPTVSQIVRFMYDVTEPVLAPIRNVLPQGLGMDFSPLLVFLAIDIIRRILFSALL